MSKHLSDWSWKEDEPKRKKINVKKMNVSKAKRKRNKKKAKKEKALGLISDSFYKSKEWRRLRYRVLRKYSAECMCCGRSKKEHGVVVHVDHIKPKSKYPELALEFKNMQVLCEDCNLGKGNTDNIDWRPEGVEKDKLELEQEDYEIQLIIKSPV